MHLPFPRREAFWELSSIVRRILRMGSRRGGSDSILVAALDMGPRPCASFVSRAISILYIAVLHVNAATTCAAKVQAALKTVRGDPGIGVSCCRPDEPVCQWSETGDCDAGSTYGWCLSAGSSKACAIAYGPDPDEPCGAYGGPVGKTYGMSPVGTGYKVALQSPAIEAALRANWASVSKLSDVGLCCSYADVHGAAACHVGSILMLSHNPCNPGEYEFKCYGTATHGLCTVYRNVSSTTEMGQYYFDLCYVWSGPYHIWSGPYHIFPNPLIPDCILLNGIHTCFQLDLGAHGFKQLCNVWISLYRIIPNCILLNRIHTRYT
ncbi:hypothetical protein EXIGLDRAFT_833542 [Exidia glandulosa HHB12029]|uniref:Uncharacterized protein n=1 Tax=Exidia glandulosa HHB12029 TaxID=1314781 RepID=A0A165KMU6_EXIGL|nr:hypothetical protein EXIGLDRAFT_833542 [Exidia glandulosa HHB12029]